MTPSMWLQSAFNQPSMCIPDPGPFKGALGSGPQPSIIEVAVLIAKRDGKAAA